MTVGGAGRGPGEVGAALRATSLAALFVGGVGPEAPPVPAATGGPGIDLAAASDWYARASGGCFTPRFVRLGPVALPRPASWYWPAGGMGRPPHNSQQLAEDAVARLPEHERADLPETLVIVVPRGFHPHTWRFRGGGFRIADARWCLRYAILPADAPLGAVVHEIGHLVLGWPDLDERSGLGAECLMALGGSHDQGRNPAQPCGPLALGAGWRRTFSLERATRVSDLDACSLGRFPSASGPILVEARHDLGQPRLLVYADDRSRPRLLARVALTPRDASRPVLAVLAPSLRRL